jgi:hypothetical protein
VLFAGFNSSDGVTYRATANIKSTGAWYIEVNDAYGASATSDISRDLDKNEWIDVVFARTGGDTLALYTKAAGESTWTTEFDNLASDARTVAKVSFGCWDADWADGSDIAVYIDDFCVSDTSLSEVQQHHYLCGSGIRDVTNTAVAPVLITPNNLWQSATHARFTYDTDAGFLSSASGPWVAISGASNSALALGPITGLSPGARYYGRFEIATAANPANIVFTSDTYTFMPLPGEGQEIEMLLWTGSCYVNRAPFHPYEYNAQVADAIEASDSEYIGAWHTGDQGYEAGSPVDADTDYGWPGGETAPETQADFQLQLREWYADYADERLRKLGPFINQPDDHQVIDQANARMAPGEPQAATLANSSAEDRTGGSYSAGTTLGDLYTAGLTVFDDMETGHWINPAASGKYYQNRTFGCYQLTMIDTRFQRGTTTYINYDGAQKAWIKQQIDAFEDNADLKVLILMAPTCFDADLGKGSSEGCGNYSQAEYEEIIDYIYDSAGTGGTGVSTSKKVVLISGDDHMGFCFHDHIVTVAHATMAAPFVGELKSSGGAVSFLDLTTEYATYSSNVKWKYTPGITTFTCVRSGGVLLNLRSNGGLIKARSWAP